MGDGLVKGTSGNLWVKSWSTVIGANTVYVSVTSATSNMVSSVWNDTAGRATITGLKCGDFQMKAEIRSGSSQTYIYSGAYSYTTGGYDYEKMDGNIFSFDFFDCILRM